MSSQPPRILVPGWRELESGLLVPSSVADRVTGGRERINLPRELLALPKPVVLLTQLPGSNDQILGAVTERELGLDPPATLAEFVAAVEALPFEPAFAFAAKVVAVVLASRENVERQLEVVRLFAMPDLEARLEQAVRQGPRGERRVVFSEQFLTVLERAMVLHARDAKIDDPVTADDCSRTISAYFAATSVTSSADEGLLASDATAQDYLTYQIKSWLYHARSTRVNAVARARELFVVLPPRLADDAHFCPIDQWLTEDTGLDAATQHAVGVALAHLSNALQDDIDPARYDLTLIAPPFGEGRLAGKADQIAALLSGSRQWFIDAFGANGGDIGAIAWDRTPFLRRPFLRLTDGRWLLISPRMIESWLGDGFYHRVLEGARARGEADRFLTFYGKLVEAYCVDLVRSVYGDPAELGAGRVHGDLPYGRGGGKRTPDVAVDLGPDLVLVEVVAARFPVGVHVDGDLQAMERALERMLFKKMGQLGRRIAEILGGEASIPDVDISHVSRIWPVVVTGGDLVQTELLWDRIDAELPSELRAARVQPLTVLDINDLELMLGLVSAGQHLPDILGRKASGPYRRLEIGRWMHEVLRLPIPLTACPPVIYERWDALGEEMRGVLFPSG